MLTAAVVILFIALVIASWRDIKTREVPDTLSYALITVGILGGLMAALVMSDISIFLDHLFGLIAGVAIGLVMYYGRQWGGGDAKLMMGVGAIIGFSLENTRLIEYLLLLLLCGAAYGMAWTAGLAIVHRKKFIPAFKERLRTRSVHRLRITLVIIGAITVLIVIIAPFPIKITAGFILLGLYFLTYSWIFVRTIENSVMVKEYPVKKLTEGDWIAKDVIVHKKTLVSAKTPGITLEQIALLKSAKVKSVMVREGVPFVPGFLLAFITLMILESTVGSGWFLRMLFV